MGGNVAGRTRYKGCSWLGNIVGSIALTIGLQGGPRTTAPTPRYGAPFGARAKETLAWVFSVESCAQLLRP